MLSARIVVAATWAIAVLPFAGNPSHAGAPLEIVSASYFGSGEDDDLQGATFAAGGTIYVVGNTGATVDNLPGGLKPKVFGTPDRAPKCGHGFVAHLSGDGKQMLQYADFACGNVLLTTVAVGRSGVYVAGYAAQPVDALLTGHPGFIRTWPLSEQVRQHEADLAAGKKDPIANRPGLGRYGAPCVLRLSPDLQTLVSGTYLEGWQQVWDKFRVMGHSKVRTAPLHEFFWQPTHLAVLASGDVIIGHDGGYFRLLTEQEQAESGGDAKRLEQLAFYDSGDWVSRLSPDLAERRWRTPVNTPKTNPETTRRLKGGWSIPHYGNPRTHRMRLDKNESIYLCGWSASFTSKEPYWSPYIWRLDPHDGKVTWKAYEYDPMSGSDNRMNGTVADTAVATLALEDDGNLLASLFADGGNTVIGMSPRADGSRFEGKIHGKDFGVHLVHWWGQVHRVDVATRKGVGGARIGPWGWVTDLASLPDRGVLAVGRYNGEFDFSDDAWQKASPVENPNAFLRVYDADFELRFSTSLHGVVPFEIGRGGKDLYLIAGRADSGLAVSKDSAGGGPHGKSDGYLMVLRFKDN
ncbi:MAG: hypothetical protein ABSG86_16540 [Thermoguttaceae bacterium]|jgi:hypothetical protein